MSNEPARTADRRHIRSTLLAALAALSVVSVALMGVHQDRALSPPSPPSLGAPRAPGRPPGDSRNASTEIDGVVPAGVTAFDDQYPAVAKLDPDLLSALQQATTDAAGDGIAIHVNSGWRSSAYQEQLLLAAISKYGSTEEAARWVASPGVSAHVQGKAVDIGPFRAAAWLSRHGANYGLCQIYRDEAWHYELRPQAIDRRYPHMYDDPTHDPRLQQ